MKKRLIDADALEKLFEEECAGECPICGYSNEGCPCGFIKTVPTINPVRKFIEIRTTYAPDELVANPEYKGKPYYSIVYEENGEQFCGFGTYKIEVLSRYLRDYFIIGEEDTKDETETY